MTNEEAINVLTEQLAYSDDVLPARLREAYEVAIDSIKNRVDAIRWIPIKTRPLTEEEKKEYEDECEWYEFIYDCELPEHGQEVLVQLHYGIALTTFYTDMGCYFEGYEDEDDVLAWMPLPKEFVKLKS